MLTSWLVAWSICSIKDRFIGLKPRRDEEIWKIELDYIKEQLQAKNDVNIAKPLLETAEQDAELAIHDEKDFKNLVSLWQIDNKKIW